MPFVLSSSQSVPSELICIPSRGRFKDRSRTWMSFKTDKRMFVREDEYLFYQKLYGKESLVCLPSGTEGIASTKQFIFDWAHANKVSRIILADDDLIFHYRQGDGKFKRMNQDMDFDSISYDIFSAIANGDAEAVSLPGRFLANNLPRGLTLYKRLACFWGANVPAIMNKKIRYGKVPVQVDLLFGLEMLLSGLRTALYCEYAHDQEYGFGAPGGCSTFRTAEVLNYASKKMAHLYPDYVKVFIRESSTFESASKDGQRTEVRVQWKKAYQSSQKG